MDCNDNGCDCESLPPLDMPSTADPIDSCTECPTVGTMTTGAWMPENSPVPFVYQITVKECAHRHVIMFTELRSTGPHVIQSKMTMKGNLS